MVISVKARSVFATALFTLASFGAAQLRIEMVLAQNVPPFQINERFERAKGGTFSDIVIVAGPGGVSLTFSVDFSRERAVVSLSGAPVNFQERCFFPRSSITSPARLYPGLGATVLVGIANCTRTPSVGFWSGHEDSIETPNLQVAQSLIRYINCAVGFTCKGRVKTSQQPENTGSLPKPTPTPAKTTNVKVWVEDGPSLPAPYNSGVFFIRFANLGQTTVRFDYGRVYDCVNIANCQMSGTGFVVPPGSTITIATLMSPEVCTDPLNQDGTPASNACAKAQAQKPSFQYTYHYTVLKQ